MPEQASGIRGGPVNLELQQWLLRLFPSGNGQQHWYVEAGAHDGHGASQTMWLEDLGWQGLLVEPSMSFMGIKANRKCKTDNRVLAGHDGEVIWREMIGDARELSGIPKHFYDHWDRDSKQHLETKKRCVTLTKMLSEHSMPPVIQFLCLDTEGSEPEILKAHDFSKFKMLTLWVEYNGVVARRKELEELMTLKGYARPMDTGHDLLFVSRELL